MQRGVSWVRSLPPRLATSVGGSMVPVPPTIVEALRRPATGGRVRVARWRIVDGRLVIPIASDHGRDRLHFSVPEGFRTHDDLVAAATTPLLARNELITYDFPVSERLRVAIESRTGARVVSAGTGDPRPSGERIALSFSGGMDSLAAWLLAPHHVTRVAVDFGSWFRRERQFFETLEPDVVCATDLRSKGYAADDWLYMGAAMILFADHLDLGWIGFGTNFESAPRAFHPPGWVPKTRDASPMPRFINAVGLQGCALTRGMTEFCGSVVVDAFAPDLATRSLRSVARTGTEKSFRKQLAYDSAVAFRGGPPVDLENRRLPRRKIRMWHSYPVDFAMLVFMAMFPPQFVHRVVGGLEPGLLDAAREIDPDFVFRCNPMFVEQFPPLVRDTVLRRLADAGVEMYRDDDWPEYEKLRRILALHYPTA